ncbi:MAG TPA: metallophosphoesterase family protein [Deltaproteobacteria bacterium]|nr:metallophosphoesterase family protein [Deltaproteobacteria bacterium]HPJ94365.1 metallophosphoesterase family protein [Deltaproteobacteria bacterium]
MTKIGVISDTHRRSPDTFLETVIRKHFHDVEMVIHAGDMVTLDVLDLFMALDKEVIAVCGNMDSADVQRSYPTSRTIRIEELSIGIIHGWGSPHGIRRRIRTSFERVDAIIYGHTHQAFCAYEAGIFFFNPGSPTDSRFTSSNSIGIIRIDGKMIEGEIISL